MPPETAESIKPIEWEEALRLVCAAARPLATERLPLAQTWDHVCAADVPSAIDVPPFDNSSMDGYAVRAADVASAPVELKVIGTAAAGAPFVGKAEADTAIEIMT